MDCIDAMQGQHFYTMKYDEVDFRVNCWDSKRMAGSHFLLSSVACNVVAKNRFCNNNSCHLHATGSKHRQLFWY